MSVLILLISFLSFIFCDAADRHQVSASPNDRFIESGIASWYGDDFHGATTANGETYDMEALTAAHRTLPFNTIVLVENRDNGRAVIVRINDRGPFIEDRVIDLSRRAAEEIGMITTGLANVDLYEVTEVRNQ